MNYIVFDLEFNQDLPPLQEPAIASENTISSQNTPSNKEQQPAPPMGPSSRGDGSANTPVKRMPFEILQIGALKLDQEFRTLDTFTRLVKPTLYPLVSPFITELTGITTDQLMGEVTFPEVYQAFVRFVGTGDSAFCVWGKSDVKELYRNVLYHDLEQQLLPKHYLNIQPYASEYLGFPVKKLLRLQYTVEALGIPLSYGFHDALGDAYYTAEILKKVYQSSMKLKAYDPQRELSRPRKPKQFIDYEKLLKQFEKMYDRELTEEEKNMIKLAYHMGKTRQFIRE